MMRPTPTALIRVSAVVALLYFLGHASGFPWTPGSGADAGAVVNGMRAVTFDAEGATRTYWDFYLGFGLIISAFLLSQAVLLWWLGGVARDNPSRVLPGLVAVMGLFVVNAGLGFRYFFAMPAVMALTIVVLLLIATGLLRGASRQLT